MSYTLRIETSSSTGRLNIVDPDNVGDSSLPSLQTLRIERKIARQPSETDRAEATVWRDAWDDVESSIDRTNDTVFVEDPSGTDIFGGRFNDWQFNGATVSVLIDSPKRDAIDAQKSGGNDAYGPKSDDAIVQNDLLSRVGTVSAGTITQQTASIPFSEQHASPGKSITRLAKHTGSETRYTPAFELDYVDSLGSSQATTLSPGNQNVIGDIRLREKIREDVTHLTVLGRGKGTEQVEATAVAPSYAAGDRRVGRVHPDKTIVEQTRAQSLADELIAEYDGAPEYVEIETELVPSLDPSLGDTYTINLPEYSVNTDLRIIMLERIIDSAGERFRALLSNRTLTRETRGEQQTRSVDEFGSGDPGQYYALVSGEGWDAVGNGEPYEWTFYRPQNTIGEYRAKLRLESREYRLRADQVGHTHDVSVTHPSHSHNVSTTSQNNSEQNQVFGAGDDGSFNSVTVSNSSWTDIYDPSTVFSDTQLALFGIYIGGTNANGDFAAEYRLKNKTTNTERPDTGGVRVQTPGGETTNVWFAEMKNINGDDIVLQGKADEGSDQSALYAGYAQAVDPHTHDVSDTTTAELGTTETATSTSVAAVDPGINTISNEQVSNVSVDVAGTAVASGLSAPISNTIDIAGELSDGANAISITSDTLGELRATIEYEAIKNAQP